MTIAARGKISRKFLSTNDAAAVGALLLFGDVLAVGIALVLGSEVARLAYGGIPGSFGESELASEVDRARQVVALAVPFFLWLWIDGHYSRRLPLLAEFKSVMAAGVVLALVDAYFQLMAKNGSPSRLWIIAIWASAAGLTLVSRILIKHVLFRVGIWRCPTLVIGSRHQAEVLAGLLRSDSHLGYAPDDMIDTDRCDSISELRLRLASGRIRYVVIAFDATGERTSLELARIVDEEFRLPLGIVIALEGIALGDLEIRQTVGADILTLNDRRRSQSSTRHICKRTFDTIVATLVLLLAAPVLLVVALLVKLDGGPVLYGSPRLGRGGSVFTAFKFRSMIPNAEAALRDLISGDPTARSEWGTRFKLSNDPRITWIGHFLRRTSLDELPQLFNVLRGEMSLVGPRPLLPDERVRYGEPAFVIYSRATPGVTGIWQVSGRDDLEYERRIELNNWYVKNWSLWLDLFILAKTAVVIARRSGAS